MTTTAWSYLAVALGSAIGGVARFWLTTVVIRHVTGAFPWGTVIVNVTSSFAIGFFASVAIVPAGKDSLALLVRQFLMAGICGGYTTFSAFSLQTLELARSGAWLPAGANILFSVVCCLVAVWLGHV